MYCIHCRRTYHEESPLQYLIRGLGLASFYDVLAAYARIKCPHCGGLLHRWDRA